MIKALIHTGVVIAWIAFVIAICVMFFLSHSLNDRFELLEHRHLSHEQHQLNLLIQEVVDAQGRQEHKI